MGHSFLVLYLRFHEGALFSLKTFQGNGWLGLEDTFPFGFDASFLGCCHPVIFMEGFRKDSRDGGPEGGPERWILQISRPKAGLLLFLVFGHMEISRSVLLGIFL